MGQEFWIQFAIQTVLGLVAVAMQNPKSSTFQKFKKPLRILRDSLMQLPLDETPQIGK